MKKLIAILGGGDWNDASVEHIVLDTDTPLEELKKDWDKWYEKTYLPLFHKNKQPKFQTFGEWLVALGYASEATDEDVVIFDDAY